MAVMACPELKPGRGRAVDLDRAEQVVVADDLRRGGLRDRHQVVERDHRPAIRAHIKLLDVLRLAPELLVGLHVHTIGPVVEVEIVHIRRAHVDAQRIGDLRQRDVQALCFFAVDRDQVLRVTARYRW